MGRGKKGNSLEAITQAISRIVGGSHNVPTSLRMASAGAHRRYFEKSPGGAAVFYGPPTTVPPPPAASPPDVEEGDESPPPTATPPPPPPVLDPIEVECTKLFSSPGSEVIVAGSPSATSVVNGFEGGSVHSELGKALKIFATALVDLFAKGPHSVVDFFDKWPAVLQSAQQKYSFELQGFGPLLSFVFFQVVQSRKKYYEALKKAALPNSVESIDALMSALQIMREALLDPSREEAESRPAAIKSPTVQNGPTGALNNNSKKSPSRPKKPLQQPAPPPLPLTEDATDSVPDELREKRSSRAPRRHNRGEEGQTVSPPRRRIAANVVQPAFRLDDESLHHHSHEDYTQLAQRRQSFPTRTGASHGVLQPNKSHDFVDERLPPAAQSTKELLAKGACLLGGPAPASLHFSSPVTGGDGVSERAVVEIRQALFAPQFLVAPPGGLPPAPPPSHRKRVLKPLPVPHQHSSRTTLDTARNVPLTLVTTSALSPSHYSEQAEYSLHTNVYQEPQDAPAAPSSQAWRSYWETKDREKLKEQWGYASITDYKSRDLLQYAENLDRMRREILGEEANKHGSRVRELPDFAERELPASNSSD